MKKNHMRTSSDNLRNEHHSVIVEAHYQICISRLTPNSSRTIWNSQVSMSNRRANNNLYYDRRQLLFLIPRNKWSKLSILGLQTPTLEYLFRGVIFRVDIRGCFVNSFSTNFLDVKYKLINIFRHFALHKQF